METLLSIIFALLIILFAGLMFMASAYKDETWDELYKKLGLK